MGRELGVGVMLAWLLVGCTDTIPLPDEFDAAFSTGRVCTPSNVATGPGTTYPVRFELCLYRCVTIDRSTARLLSAWTGSTEPSAVPAQMVLLATGHVFKLASEKDCDARDLPNPPPGECSTEIFDFTVGTPNLNDVPREGDFNVTIPYLSLDQGQEVVDRIDSGEPPLTVIDQVVGPQMYPQRQFSLNFATTNPPVASPDDIAPEDCHEITAP